MKQRTTIINFSIYNMAASAALFILSTTVIGCDMEAEIKVPSDDMAALRNIVQLEMSVKSGKYEIFSTPETTSGVPGPTDYATLIGDFEIDKNEKLETPPVPSMWLVPNLVRPWLSEPFKSLAQKYRSKKIPEDYPACSLTTGTLKHDNQRLRGIKCVVEGRMLIYLPLFNADGR